jgi:hypothetical protein
MRITKPVFSVLMGLSLGGCGLYVPEKHEIYEGQPNAKALENVIVNNVKCELRKAVADTEAEFANSGRYPGNDIRWLDKQGATVNLKISVDEKSSFNPGLALNTPLPNAQSFSLGLGASSSVDTTRVETVAFTYSFADLKAENAVKAPPKKCINEDGILIESDLKIAQFMEDKLFLAAVPGSVVTEQNEQKAKKGKKQAKELASPFSVFSYEVTFVAAYGGNATPTWKLLRATVDPTSPLFNTSRQKTNDLTITIGAAKPATSSSAAVLSNEAQQVHFAHLIGQSVATAIQSQQHP